jgi:phenylalanyl-tRNA synthetase beta chain
MKVSFHWLSQYIDINDYRSRLPQLSQLLTQAGLEVEEMSHPAQAWNKVVVGELVEVGRHPDADKLTLCQVNIGAAKPLQIVCGAKNHKSGDFVAVAQVGAVLPGNFKIKQSKIRGVESSGMLCSESELGLSEESEGILILPSQYKPGTALAELEDLADIIFELNVTPNRADCLSHLGLARELATLIDRPLRPPANQTTSSGELTQVQVMVEDAEACPRYCGRVVSGVKVGPSPDWLQRRLQSIGLNSVNNIVDITNFVLFEYGQPLHAFDLSQIQGQQIVVNRAQPREKFVTLDGTEIELNETDLVIRDGQRPVALAGVVGGQNSGVTESTTDIFLESAFFRAEGVRRTSRAHGIETDSCYRFSRGVDPAQTQVALNRAAQLIQEVAGGEVLPGLVDIYPQPHTVQPILVSTGYIAQRLGLSVQDGEFKKWMERLGCEVKKQGELWQVTPPTYRWDLSIKEDLVEEYARLNGYDQLQEKLPTLEQEPSRHTPLFDGQLKAQSCLCGMGLHQCVNYAFVGSNQSRDLWSDKSETYGLKMSAQEIKLLNPISEDLSVMRQSLLPSLLKNLIFNHHRGNLYGRVFELAPTHGVESGQFFEENHLALSFWGHPQGLWQNKKPVPVVFQLKSVVESFLRKLGGNRWRWDQVEAKDCPPGFHPTQTATLFYEGSRVGLLGTIHPSLCEQNKIRVDAAWAELNFEALMVRQPRTAKFKSLPKYPGVERDVAFIGSEKVSALDIGNEIKRAGGTLLQDFNVFDLYQDDGLKSKGLRSIAFRLRFQSEQQTLTDEEVNGLRDQVVNSVCQKLGLEIR